MDQDKSKMETKLRSIWDEILESKLTAILSSILDAKLRTYEESMSFFNTYFESMKDKINGLEKQTNTLTGKFNIRFAAVKVWNDWDENIKYLPLKMFKNEVKLIITSYRNTANINECSSGT